MAKTVTVKASKNRVTLHIPSTHYQDSDMYAHFTFEQAQDLVKVIQEAITAFELGQDLVEEVSKSLRWATKD